MIKKFLLLVVTGTGIAILFWGGSILKQCRRCVELASNTRAHDFIGVDY